MKRLEEAPKSPEKLLRGSSEMLRKCSKIFLPLFGLAPKFGLSFMFWLVFYPCRACAGAGVCVFRGASGFACLVLIKLFAAASGRFVVPEISSCFLRVSSWFTSATMLQPAPRAAVESRRKFRTDFQGPLTSIISRFNGSKVLIDRGAPYIVTSTLD